MMNNRCRSRLMGRWLLMVMLLGLWSSHARGQMGFGALPPPMSGGDLADVLSRVDISPQQQVAIDGFHDAYLQQYTELREGPHTEFMEDARSMRNVGMSVTRAQVEPLLDGYVDLLNRAARLDNRLFDQAQTVMSPEQVMMMHRVRQQRERTRLGSGVLQGVRMVNRAASVDLVDIVDGAALSPDGRTAVDATLAQYESRRTSDFRRLFRRANDLILETVEQLESLDLESAMADPEQQQAMIETLQGMWGELQREMMAEAGELSDHNRRSIITMTAVLDDADERTLRWRYLLRAYGSDVSVRLKSRPRLESASQLDTLSAEQQTALIQLTDQFHLSFDALAARMMDVVDKQRTTEQPFDFFGDREDSSEQDALKERLVRLRNEAEALDTRTLAALEDILDSKQEAMVSARAAGAGTADGLSGDPDSKEGADKGAEVATKKDTAITKALSRDEWIPAPMTRREIVDYTSTLALDDTDVAIAQSLHDDYADTFESLEEGPIAIVQTMSKDLWHYDADTDTKTAPTREAIDRLFDQRKSVIDQVHAADAAFFENLRLVLGEPRADAISQLELTRRRDVYGRRALIEMKRAAEGESSGRRRWWQVGREHEIDLGRVWSAVTEEHPASTSTDTASIVREYGPSITEQFRILFESSFRLARIEAHNVASYSRAAQEDGESMTWRRDNSDDREEMIRESRNRARQQITDINRATRHALIAAISGDAAAMLERAYAREAFPAVFRDSRSAALTLDTVRALDTLSPQQQTRLNVVAADFRAAYDQITRDLIANHESLAEMERQGYRDRDWERFGELVGAAERLEFSRDDLNTKTRNQLRALLTDDQRAAVPGLATEPTS